MEPDFEELALALEQPPKGQAHANVVGFDEGYPRVLPTGWNEGMQQSFSENHRHLSWPAADCSEQDQPRSAKHLALG